MPQNNLDIILVKLMVFLPKAFGAVIGAILSLVLSGDIDTDGKLQLSIGVITKVVVSAVSGAYLGQLFIDYKELHNLSVMSQGGIMMLCSAFSLLVLGIFYQTIEMNRGKRLSEIVTEVKEAFIAIFK
ncbi:hypothetical protein [Psychrobacter sp. I-STPA6b]|uniref:hypothetical protein n=1 Tax=Psychrobacter sp. I-STPA6b TaxID=2585718 RepID=UPI001D0CD2F5|nr:hypothetical protein [Psychrobacter sp. I-STPA6b]